MIKQWLCSYCKALLGCVEDNVLRIKRKDLYVEVKGGEVTVICRKCGKGNTVKDEAIDVKG